MSGDLLDTGGFGQDEAGFGRILTPFLKMIARHAAAHPALERLVQKRSLLLATRRST